MENERCEDHAVTKPELVFPLTQSETIVHPLQDVARTRLCCVDLDFGSERVSGILDTGAQRLLLNTLSYELGNLWYRLYTSLYQGRRVL